MGRSQQYKDRKKAFTKKKGQFISDQPIDLSTACSSKSIEIKHKKSVKEEECFSESSNQPESDCDNLSCSSSTSNSEDELAKSESLIAKQQFTNEKLKVYD